MNTVISQAALYRYYNVTADSIYNFIHTAAAHPGFASDTDAAAAAADSIWKTASIKYLITDTSISPFSNIDSSFVFGNSLVNASKDNIISFLISLKAKSYPCLSTLADSLFQSGINVNIENEDNIYLYDFNTGLLTDIDITDCFDNAGLLKSSTLYQTLVSNSNFSNIIGLSDAKGTPLNKPTLYKIFKIKSGI